MKKKKKKKRFNFLGRGKKMNNTIEEGDTIVVNSAKFGVDKYFGMVGEVVNASNRPGFISKFYDVRFDAIKTTVRFFSEDELKLLKKKGSRVELKKDERKVEPIEAQTPEIVAEGEESEDESEVKTIKLQETSFIQASKTFVCYVGPKDLDEYVREQKLPKGMELREKALDLFFENEDLLPLLSVMKEFRLYMRNHCMKDERRLLWEIVLDEEIERTSPESTETTKEAEPIQKSEPKPEEQSSSPFLGPI